MLDKFFSSRCSLDRIRKTPFCEYLEELARHLDGQGYRRFVVQAYVRAAGRFLTWLEAMKIPLEIVDKAHARQFMHETMTVVRNRRQVPGSAWYGAHAGVRHLVQLLRDRFGEVPPATPVEASVVAFHHHMRDQCGYADTTIYERTGFVREFLSSFFGEGPVDVLHVTAAEVLERVSQEARCRTSQKACHLATSLRCYFRFLQFQGLPVAHLYAAVPHVPRPRDGAARPVLTAEQVRTFLKAFDRSQPRGRRDYAIALCLADLGMRASDAASLVLEDVDWRRGVIRVPNIKTRHPYQLPLPDRVGRAMIDYLRHGRPQTPLRQVFLRHQTPVGKLHFGSVQQAMRVAYQRSGLPMAWQGSHILRRTAATGMRRRGVSLKEIADVLGHQSIDTTVRYARLDPAALATVALPWPEEQR